MNSVFDHCFQVLGVGDLVNAILGGRTQFAVASTLSRLQIIIDIDLCYYHQRIPQQGSGPIYLWIDSSPIAGCNWLMSMYTYFQTNDDCVQCFDAVP